MRLIAKKFPQNIYHWSGISAQGQKIGGQVQAFSLNLAKIQLAEQNIRLTMIRKKSKLSIKRSSKISNIDITIFFRQLATLITAGIPLVQSLEILSQNNQHQGLQILLNILKIDLESGISLFRAMSKHTLHFDNITCQLIHIAEQTGTLDRLLSRLANNREKNHALTAQFKQALIYPGIMLTLSFVITIAMMIIVVPRFAAIFADFHAKLPLLTQALISTADYLQNNYWMLIIPLAGARLFFYIYQQSPYLKLITDKWILRIPMVGQLLQKFICARLAYTLAIMLKAGVPMMDALIMLVDISNNSAVKAALGQLHHEINSGNRIHVAMNGVSVFPALMTHMIKIGEESGTLDAMLEKIAEFYEADVSYWVSNFHQVLEPLIIIIIGVVIGSMVIALYLPIFKLGSII